MAYRQKTIDHAEQVWAALDEYARTGARIRDLANDTGLTYQQVRHAIACLRDELQEDNEQPIVCLQVGQSFRYYLAEYWEQEVEYLAWDLKGQATHLNRLTHNLAAAELKWPEKARTARRINRRIELAAEDITAMLDEISRNGVVVE